MLNACITIKRKDIKHAWRTARITETVTTVQDLVGVGKATSPGAGTPPIRQCRRGWVGILALTTGGPGGRQEDDHIRRRAPVTGAHPDRDLKTPASHMLS